MIEIVVDENPSTGYRWQIETNADLISDTYVSKREFNMGNEPVIGGGGKRYIELRPPSGEDLKLQMTLKHSWEINNESKDSSK